MAEYTANTTPRRKKKKPVFKDYLKLALFFWACFLWIEIIYRLFYVDTFFDNGLFFIIIFTFPIALICALLGSLCKRKGNRKVIAILLALATLWTMIQSVYRTIFRSPLLLNSFEMAGQALTNYWRETLSGILKTLPCLLLLAIPLVVYLLFQHRIARRRLNGKIGFGLVAFILIAVLVGELCTFLPTSNPITIREIYRQSFDPTMTISKFGILSEFRIDLTQMLFGLEEEEVPQVTPTPSTPVKQTKDKDKKKDNVDAEASPEVSLEPTFEPTPTPVVYEPNIMDIDWDTIIANETNSTLKDMHEFFSQREGTMQNEYTGMFKGKNLIFITAEGFWKYAVSETYTPTLYKLANEGFVFNNFYNPLGTHSTLDGEYANCTGLVPSNSFFSFYQTEGNSMYFCLGNQLRKEGYTTAAYHDHTYNYYKRDISHPNMGYDYYGLGKGLEVKKSWPESDLEMMQKVIPQYLEAGNPFHLYFMTVSGHMNYNFMGNTMANKHRNDVSGMTGYSEEARAYVACQMELDAALEYLLKQLAAYNQLENTVICLSGDHYPYGMEESTWSELAGFEMDKTFELSHSTLILWSGCMEEPVQVDKICCSIDIMPTLSNLFGLEYDSRLLMGRDILSDCEGIAVFNNKNFITEYGKYDASNGKFYPAEGVTVPEDYAADMFAELKKLYTYSDKIVKNDYYRKIGLVPVKK